LASLKCQQNLCIDDDKDTLELLSYVLSGNGYEVIQASTLAEGRILIGAQNFDCIVLDERLPDGDGSDLCGEIRRRDLDVPILIISADARLKTRMRALDSGTHLFLTKPIDPFLLLDIIDDQFG